MGNLLLKIVCRIIRCSMFHKAREGINKSRRVKKIQPDWGRFATMFYALIEY